MGPILLVESNEKVRDELIPALSREGIDVHCAKDGVEALSQLAEGKIRLVISNCKAPRLDGLELCHRIRQGEFGGYVYVILMTSTDSIDERIQGLTAGADDFVSQPIHPSELIARIQVGRRVLQLETREALIFSLAKLAESRDPETGDHIERVQWYSRSLAEHLSEDPRFSDTITPQFVHLIFQTSPLHDIGKVGVPDNVLLKPGRLTGEEFEEIKKHPVVGAETLRGAIERSPDAAFLRMAYDIALSHHEKFDGSGYPNGLAGHEIPLSARIVALADVYDALTTNRVYKAAYSHDKAKGIILEGRGGHFDPDIVEAFLAIEDKFQTIRRRYQGSEKPLQIAPSAAFHTGSLMLPTQ